jgi:hypothetical protein
MSPHHLRRPLAAPTATFSPSSLTCRSPYSLRRWSVPIFSCDQQKSGHDTIFHISHRSQRPRRRQSLPSSDDSTCRPLGLFLPPMPVLYQLMLFEAFCAASLLLDLFCLDIWRSTTHAAFLTEPPLYRYGTDASILLSAVTQRTDRSQTDSWRLI